MTGVRIYLITDPGIDDVPGAVEQALAAVPHGAAAVQLRDRLASGRQLLAAARRLAPVCRAAGAPLLINDRADVALAVGAGVHLRRDSASAAEVRGLGIERVGMSTHSIGEVKQAAASGCDFVVFGPVFATPGKGEPVGLDALSSAVGQGIPVYALGGVDGSNAASCLRAGAAGVACIRAVLGAARPGQAARALAKEVLS